MSRARLFGTLFYANYLTRALALYHSMQTYFAGDFTLVMLCMDEEAVRVVESLRLPNVEPVSILNLERTFPELGAVKRSRSIAEYSWTTTPFLLRNLVSRAGAGDGVVYLDADMMFYSDPQPIFDEIGGADIAIHAHRYAPRHSHFERQSGIFNVGWVGVRNNVEGNRCLSRWAAQCIDLCVYDVERGLCGDQKYLEEWPTLYKGLAVIEHKGAGLGPWNLERHELSRGGAGPMVDGEPVIFYHFSSLRILRNEFFGRFVMIPAVGYRFSSIQRDLIYRPYARRLRDAYREISTIAAPSVLAERRPSFAELRAARLGVLIA